jgi:hypothetical protein
MKASDIKKLIKTEINSVLNDEFKEITKTLEELHKVILENALCEVEQSRDGRPRYFKSMTLENVSKLTKIPVNNLMLYFLNGQRLNYENQLVEMRQRVVYFYKPEN